ncbi:hypothetical protein I5L51_17970 [Pseudomonas mendocina]|nr:hypothetical protein [Pseudomonas mendocina]MBH3341002.1 hypothetical protein [Pseudomonas mendocina]
MYGLPKRKHAANGGLIVGPGTGTSDSIEKTVPAGTYILPADTTKKLGFGIPGYGGNPKELAREQPRLGIPRKQVPVAVSNGEYELPPEQVHAIGAALLDQVKDGTHKPAGLGLSKAMLATARGGVQQEPRHFFADGGLVDDEQKPKQTSFDITNTPAAQRAAGISGDLARAERMQAQFDQPVTGPRGSVGSAPASGGRFGLPGYNGASMSANRPAPVQETPPGSPGVAAEGAARTQDENGSTAPSQVGQQPGNRWVNAGNGIAMRLGANGSPEFSNDPTTLAGAGAMPAGGMSRIGDGVGGGLSVGEPGDAQMAIDRFERANQERQRMIEISQRGELGNNGGKLTIVRDSSRNPFLSNRLEKRDTELNQLKQENFSGAQRQETERLQQRKLEQDIQGQEQVLQANRGLNESLARLNDPKLQGDARTQAERQYLLQVDPTGFAKAQAASAGDGDNAKLTEQQSKDLGYYTRGNQANAQLAQQGDALTARPAGDRGQLRGFADTLVRGTPLLGNSALGNSLVSKERQQAEQSGREVLAAILRKDTGAAITQQEMEIYGAMYLPQPGDSDEVLNQKADARTRALASIRGGLGTAERKAAPLLDGQRAASSGPLQISDDDGYNALPSGALFIAPDGTTRRKP